MQNGQQLHPFFPARKTMDLTPISELSSTTEYEEECDMLSVVQDSKSRDKPKKEENKVMCLSDLLKIKYLW